MYNLTSGQRTEMAFKKFLLSHKATFTLVDLEECLTQQEVIDLALTYQSFRIDGVLRKNKLTLDELALWDISKLLDYLFKIDYLIEVELAEKSIWVALDVTCNPQGLQTKEMEIRQLQAPLARLGISMGIAVLWKTPPVNQPDSYKRASALLETIEFTYEKSRSYGTAILS